MAQRVTVNETIMGSIPFGGLNYLILSNMYPTYSRVGSLCLPLYSRNLSCYRNNNPQSPQSNAPSKVRAADGDEGACPTCGRRFAPERLLKHQDICRKTHAKKRKPFDVLKHRLAVSSSRGPRGWSCNFAPKLNSKNISY